MSIVMPTKASSTSPMPTVRPRIPFQPVVGRSEPRSGIDPSVFPSQIKAGPGNPIVTSGGHTSGSSITSAAASLLCRSTMIRKLGTVSDQRQPNASHYCGVSAGIHQRRRRERQCQCDRAERRSCSNTATDSTPTVYGSSPYRSG